MCLCRREDARAVRVDKEGWSLLCVFKEQIEEEQQMCVCVCLQEEQ